MKPWCSTSGPAANGPGTSSTRAPSSIPGNPTPRRSEPHLAIKLNHTIVHSLDQKAASRWYAEVFGLPEPTPFGPFLDVNVANEVTLAFLDAGGMEIQMQHYAFLVSEAEFDQIFGRVKVKRLEYWADPARSLPGKINHHFGGRGVYFQDPSGHLLEIITRPYGSS